MADKVLVVHYHSKYFEDFLAALRRTDRFDEIDKSLLKRMPDFIPALGFDNPKILEELAKSQIGPEYRFVRFNYSFTQRDMGIILTAFTPINAKSYWDKHSCERKDGNNVNALQLKFYGLSPQDFSNISHAR